MRKKIDNRIRTLITNAVKTHQRSFFVLIGDKGRDQVVNLHYMLSKATVKARPTVLWCYKKDLGFSSHRKKRIRQIKKAIERGQMEPDTDDPFELFISSTQIRYTYYKETHKVLGNTYGMCVLQDFEAITPNLLARTIETVEGGGIVVLLLKTMSSLKQLYTIAMDVHSRYRTESHQDVVGRFNERFILSLGQTKNCLICDDELNVLPLSSHIRNLAPVSTEDIEAETPAQVELKEVKASLAGEEPIGSLVATAKTLDQAKAILTFIEAIQEKTLRSTVALTAARGRGKSSALGVAMAAAVAYGYSNIFVTSPSPENLRTLFDFVFKGFDALGYQEHTDYELVQSTNPAFNKAIVRVNIFRQHRQTIQYVQPQDAAKLGQAELVVIDEAAAIPLPLVKELLGPYLVFMASTINGYEGTGRSLSLKLIKKLREQNKTVAGEAAAAAADSSSGRVLKEISLDEPIRYARGDPIERWLHELLCLDVTEVPRLLGACPHPDACELFYVNRDTLFSYHKASEAFLQRMMSLYVSSHYKNTPDDLQLMADAPAHHLFVLLAPRDPNSSSMLPEVLCVVQVCLEGEISKQSVMDSLSRGARASGDLIPWNISQQFQDNDFPSLSGARVVRIATHPDYARMGYASRALQQLTQYYQGEIPDLGEGDEAPATYRETAEEDGEGIPLVEQRLAPRKNLPPLLQALRERRAERLHWIGTSYGLTQDLFKFWKKAGFLPVYLRQTANDLTGEHTCIMLKTLRAEDLATSTSTEWLQPFNKDFQRRFVALLGYEFRAFHPSLALTVLDPPRTEGVVQDAAVLAPNPLGVAEIGSFFSGFDLARLDTYARNMVDHHVITDLVPTLARLFFTGRIPVAMPASHSAILLALGCQYKSVSEIETLFSIPSSQALALFNKTVRKLSSHLRQMQEQAADATLAPQTKTLTSMRPLKQSMDADLDEAGAEATEAMAQREEFNRQKPSFEEAITQMDLGDIEQYAVGGDAKDWDAALKGGALPKSVAIKKRLEKGSKRAHETEKGGADGNASDDEPAKKKHKPHGNFKHGGKPGGGPPGKKHGHKGHH